VLSGNVAKLVDVELVGVFVLKMELLESGESLTTTDLNSRYEI